MTERLTTLAALKEWLGIPDTQTATDPQLIRLIDAASQFTLNHLNRDSLTARQYTMNFRGNGKSYMLLRNWPVISVQSVGVGGSAIVGSVMGNNGLPGSGYMIGDLRMGPQSLDLYGYNWWMGAPSQVVYTSGFEATDTFTLSSTTHTPSDAGQWIQNVRVVIDGVDAVKVASAPTAGQYAVDEWGEYTFAAGDSGKEVKITYAYAPWDISWAVTEMIGEWYKRKDRIGILSKTLGGQESVTFSQKDMNDSVKSLLQNYVNVVPI